MARLPRPRLPRLGGLAARARAAAQRARYPLEDAAYAARGAARSLGARARELWRGLSPVARGWTVGGAVLTILVVTAWFGAPGVPCALPAGDRCPPHDDAAELVPADALAYLHTNLDPDTDQYEEATALAAALPELSRQLIALAPAPAPAPYLFYERTVLPWLGGELALALLAGERGAPQQVFLFEVEDEQGARGFARRIMGGGVESREHAGVEVLVGDRGVASAIAGGFLALGPQDGVNRVLDTLDGGADSLAADPAAERVEQGLPEDSLAEAYVSEEGVKRLLAGAGGTLGTLDTFVNYEATLGAGAALVASEEGIELAVHSELDPERLRRSPGFLDAFPPFEPKLAGELGPATLAYLGLGDPAESVVRLLQQAASGAPGLLAAFGDLARDLRERERISLAKEVLPLLGEEGAFAIGPPVPQRGGRGSGRQPPGTIGPQGIPYVAFVGTGVDTEAASEALAKLQGPLARSLDPGLGGQAPVLERGNVDGVRTHSVSVSPAVNLTYAAFDGKLAIATQPLGVERAIQGEGGLADSDLFERATEDFPDRPALIAYLNLRGLVAMAERQGLAEDPAYAFLAKEIQRLAAAGLAVERGAAELDTRLRIVVSQAED